MKKASSGRNLGANLEMLSLIYSFKRYICQDPRIARALPPEIKKKRTSSFLAQRLSAFASRCGTDTAGRGALEPPPEDGARTKLVDREFQLRESHTEAETEKTPDRIPPKKNDQIYIYIYLC